GVQPAEQRFQSAVALSDQPARVILATIPEELNVTEPTAMRLAKPAPLMASATLRPATPKATATTELTKKQAIVKSIMENNRTHAYTPVVKNEKTVTPPAAPAIAPAKPAVLPVVASAAPSKPRICFLTASSNTAENMSPTRVLSTPKAWAAN